MKANVKFEKIQAGGIETNLHSELKNMIDLLKKYLDMVFTVAHAEPDIFDADSSQWIVHQLLDGYERKIENIFQILHEKMGLLIIVESPSGRSHIEKNQVVDVYIDETRGR